MNYETQCGRLLSKDRSAPVHKAHHRSYHDINTDGGICEESLLKVLMEKFRRWVRNCGTSEKFRVSQNQNATRTLNCTVSPTSQKLRNIGKIQSFQNFRELKKRPSAFEQQKVHQILLFFNGKRHFEQLCYPYISFRREL